MFAIFFSIIELILITSLYFKHNLTLNLLNFIISIIISFAICIYHIVTYTLPYDKFLNIFIASLLLLIKHRHLLTITKSRRFLSQILKVIYQFLLFFIVCLYISTIPIPILNGIALWLSSIALSTIFAFVNYVSWSSAYGSHHFSKTIDLIMVLGAGIFTEQVTPLLAARLDRAIKVYSTQQSQTLILVSGGQGHDEPITEALAMKRYLMANGIPEEMILTEAQSINTKTNFLYSKPIIQNHFPRQSHFLCVTSQFHILRALRLAKKIGLKFDGLGNYTPYHFLCRSLLKDFLGLMHQYKILLTIYFAVLFWAAIIKLLIL